MTGIRSNDYLAGLVRELCKLPCETEWIEFKGSNKHPQEIGEYLSALANAAALNGKANAYMVWGIEDQTHNLVGTDFLPSAAKKGNEPLESWLLRLLKPKIHFTFYELQIDGKAIVLLEIGRAFRHPVRFQSEAFIRIGQVKKPLKDAPERERELWRILDQTPFENLLAMERISSDEALRLLDYSAYFDLLEQALPSGRDGILDALKRDSLIRTRPQGFTRTVLFAHKSLAVMDRAERVRACYLHACLKYVSREFLTNTSLRQRFGVEEKNKAAVSRYIREAVDAEVIKPFNEDASRKLMKYVPYWA